jgi:arginase
LGIRKNGTDLGPSAIRYAGLSREFDLLKLNYRDCGDVIVPKVEIDSSDYEKILDAVNHVNSELYYKVADSILGGNRALTLGGDHSIAIGTVLGAQKALGDIGVLWVDAHCDCNTLKTTFSGNIHGMSLAAVTGCAERHLSSFKEDSVSYVNPKKCVIIGNREVDELELEIVKKCGITVFSMADVDMIGIKGVMDKALKIVTSGTNGFHLSFDMDAVTPEEAPGVGTPKRGGFTYRESHLIVEMISEVSGLCSIDFAETNPLLDIKNQTATLAVSLISAVLGKRFTAPAPSIRD